MIPETGVETLDALINFLGLREPDPTLFPAPVGMIRKALRPVEAWEKAWNSYIKAQKSADEVFAKPSARGVKRAANMRLKAARRRLEEVGAELEGRKQAREFMDKLPFP